MSDLPPPPPPPPPPPSLPPPGADGEATSPRTWRTWHLAVAALVALVLGVGIGSTGDDADVGPVEQVAADAEGIAALEEQVADLQGELKSRDDALAAAERKIEGLQAMPEQEPESRPEPESDPEPEPEPEPDPEPELSASQRNALRAAKNYLDIMPFSRSGLIEQLEFEGYARSDATFGVDALNANWNEQAARAAKNYLDMMPFSRSGLIEQLKYEGFSHDQAVYGVDQAGL